MRRLPEGESPVDPEIAFTIRPNDTLDELVFALQLGLFAVDVEERTQALAAMLVICIDQEHCFDGKILRLGDAENIPLMELDCRQGEATYSWIYEQISRDAPDDETLQHWFKDIINHAMAADGLTGDWAAEPVADIATALGSHE